MSMPWPEELPRRLDIDAEDAGRGLGRLVVAVLELVRQLLERQAVRRVDSGSLSPDQIERLGQALMALEQRFAELRDILDPPPGPGERSGSTANQ